MATSSAATTTMEKQRQTTSTTATPGLTTPSPALTRQPPAPTVMRRGATAALFGGAGTTPTLSDHDREDDEEDDNQDLGSSGQRPLPPRLRRIGSTILGPDSQRRENNVKPSEQEESWKLYFFLIDAPTENDIVECSVNREDLTFGNLLTLKSRLGYSVRDFLYYKERCGNGVAKLVEVDSELEVAGMKTMNDEERQVRLVLSRDKITERNVNITPIKRPPGSFYEDEFTIDEYKVWLAELHEKGKGRDLHDMFRQDTVKAYSEWLRHEGELDDIEAYEDNQTIQSSNPTPPMQRPSHARREKQLANDGRGSSGKRKFKGRGVLKGFTVSNKRARQGTTKLDVLFSRMGGPVGGNRRSFVDEVVLYTKKNAPLIGVTKWKNIDDKVKIEIASDVIKKWDIEDTLENRKKILAIANERYRGWRSTLSTTYKAYDNYDERMRHKPEELHIVEWHYLVLYFGTDKFQELSEKNSENRKHVQAQHMVGSKSFDQCSYELRDPETGEEPDDCDLWAKTHSKGGKWINDASKDIYETACNKIAEKEIESTDSFIPSVEKNLIFQEAYKQVTRSKSSKVHGKGYLARYPTRRQLMTERLEDQARSETASHKENEELKATLEKVQEQLQSQVAEREAEKEEHRRQMEELKEAREADKEQLRQEFMSMLAAQRQEPSPQVNQAAIETAANNTASNETPGNETPSVAHAPILTEREETTQENEAPSAQNNLQVKQKQQLAASTPAGINARTTRGSLSRNQSQNKEGNVIPNFISTKNLTDVVAKRRSTKKN